MEKHASLSAYLTGWVSFLFGGVTLNDVAMAVGIITTLGTFILNWYYKVKEDRRRERALSQE